MRLIDHRNEARHSGASEAEIMMITREIKRECRKAKNEILRTAVTKHDWIGIRKLKTFRAQQVRMKDNNGKIGKVQPAGQRAQTIVEYFQNIQMQGLCDGRRRTWTTYRIARPFIRRLRF